jgi:hypothetical protein
MVTSVGPAPSSMVNGVDQRCWKPWSTLTQPRRSKTDSRSEVTTATPSRSLVPTLMPQR